MRGASIVFFAGIVSACQGVTAPLEDAGPAAPDAGEIIDTGLELDPDAGMLACPPGAAPGEAGPGSDRIAGAVTVFAVERIDSAPIPNATVVLESNVGRMEAITDSDGCAHFEHFALVGPVDVHFFADNRIYESDYGVDGAILTRPLLATDILTDDPRATVTGRVVGLEVVAPISLENGVFAAVIPTVDPPLQFIDPSPFRLDTPQLREDEVILGGPNIDIRDFRVKLYPDSMFGVAVVASSLRFPGGTFPPEQGPYTHVGFKTLDLEAREVRDDVVIEITHALSATLTVELLEPPDAIAFQAASRVVLPNGSSFSTGSPQQTPDPFGRYFFSVPPLNGTLSDAGYSADLLVIYEQGVFAWFHQRGETDRVVLPPAPPAPDLITASERTLTATVSGLLGEALVLMGGPNSLRWLVLAHVVDGELRFRYPEVPAGFVDPLGGGEQLVEVQWRGLTGPLDRPRATDAERRKRRWAVSVRTSTVTFRP